MTRRQRMVDDLDEDIRDHITRETEDNIARGMSPEDARSAALRAFGNVMRVKEDTRAVWISVWLEQLGQDVRFALRLLRKTPGFTIAAVMTLALAIGANALVFAVFNVFVVHPLDLPQAQSLYTLERGKDKSTFQSYPDYLDLRDRNRSFDGLAAFGVTAVGLDVAGHPTRAWADVVSGNYFDVLEIRPFLGRFFHASDERGPNSAPYIVLAYAYWHTRFDDDRGVVGRTVQINEHPFTVIGVAPPGFNGTLMFFRPDCFLPIVNQEQVDGENNLNARSNRWISWVVGHLKPDVTSSQAVADLNAIGADLEKRFPKDDGQMTFTLARPALGLSKISQGVQAFLGGLMLLAGLILVAACANLGSLFAARAAFRSRELAMRLALGAGRMRVLRQLLTESTVIALIGGAIGLWGSVELLRWLSTWRPFPAVPVQAPLQADASVYLLALLLSVGSGLLFGAASVWHVLREDPYEILKRGPISTGERRMTSRDLLLVVQIAICALLVTSSLVAVRGLMRSLHGNFGFEPEHAVLVETDLNMAGYRGEAVEAMQRRMIDAMAALPGVAAVGLVDAPPLSGPTGASAVFTEQTTDLRPANAAAQVVTFRVTPEYFRAAGTALLSGRTFSWHDDRNAPRVAVVNREFARKVFGSAANAIGRWCKTSNGARIQVVGMAEDGKYGTLTEDPQPAMFLPIAQSPSTATFLVVRSNREPGELASALRSTLSEVDRGLPSSIQTWSDAMGAARFGARMATIALGVLGVMAAMLAITGIFGMAAYSLSQRGRDLGIRIALGAQRREVLQAALGRPLKLLAFGSVAGLLLGLLATQVLALIVYQATPRDPLVMAGVVLAMCSLGVLATWIPAQRALAIDPMILMRDA
jgi:predicted permease